jgi:hypothetical protein
VTAKVKELIKDKIKEPKKIDEYSNAHQKNESDLKQCPKCYQLFTKDHKCHEVWLTCTICRVSLLKKGKKVRLKSGLIYATMPSKKYYRLINSLICHQCACNIVKKMKK